MNAVVSHAPWVFLRGLTRGSGHWGGFVAEFERTVEGAQVITPDLAGNGARFAETSAWSVNDMVQDCRSQLRAAGLASPYNVLALSMGAMVAAQWSAQWPAEVQRMVLLSTSMRPLSAFYERLRPRNYLKLLRLLLGHATPAEWERAILQMTTHSQTPEVLSHWIALRERNPVSAVNAVRQLVAAARFRLPPVDMAASQKLPWDFAHRALVLAGQGDELVSPQCSEALAAHWKCALAIHPRAGHDLPLDDGPWVARQVRGWLQQ